MAYNTLIIDGFTSNNQVLIIDGLADQQTTIYIESFFSSGLINVFGSSESTIQINFSGYGQIVLTGTALSFPELNFFGNGLVELSGTGQLFPEIFISSIGLIELTSDTKEQLVVLYPTIFLSKEKIKSFNFFNYFKTATGFVPYIIPNFHYSNFFINGKVYENYNDFSYFKWWKENKSKTIQQLSKFHYSSLFKSGTKIKEVISKKNYVDLLKKRTGNFGKINTEYNYFEDFFNA